MTSYSKKPSFKKIPAFSDIEQVAGRIIALAPNKQIYVSGSCVRIAPSLYLTARHVLMDFVDKFGFKNGGLNFTVWIAHIYEGPEYAVWEMDEFWLSPHSDMAVFHVNPYNDTAASHKAFSTVSLNLYPPSIGSRIYGWGYHSSFGQITVNESGSLHFDINGEEAVTVGEVREYHPLGTDSILRPFPCFRVNARFDGGMSGGPIFCDGELSGVICTGLPPYEESEEHCSYVSALWPLMGMVIGVNPKTGLIDDKTYTVYEHAKYGFINVIGLDNVTVTQRAESELFDVTFLNTY